MGWRQPMSDLIEQLADQRTAAARGRSSWRRRAGPELGLHPRPGLVRQDDARNRPEPELLGGHYPAVASDGLTLRIDQNRG